MVRSAAIVVPRQIPKYAVSHLENKAEKLLHDSLGESYSIPVDVEYLLESILDVDLDVWPGLEATHGIHGAVFKDIQTDQICVYVDERLADASQKRNRYRMTVAEELSHVILHRRVIDLIESIDDFRALQQHENWQDAERDAKRFAAAVLMPGSVIRKRAAAKYNFLVSKAGFGDCNVIKKYLANLLANDFEVSPHSMKIRLTEWPMKIDDKVDEAMEAQLLYLP